MPDPQHQAWLQQLRRREGSWVTWGQLCQQLHKAGWSAEAIFEETGLEPSTQNQLMVASQVFASLQAQPDLQAYFQEQGSDLLYELRLLSQSQRLACAAYVRDKGLDAATTREVVKAMKELGQYRAPPEFSDHPGDAVAFQCWRLLRQKPTSSDRGRLLARGLRFAHSEGARAALEKLLDVTPGEPLPTPPRLPWYRWESALEQPVILTLAGQLPLGETAWRETPVAQPQPPFGVVTGVSAVVALPGWPVLRTAQAPLALLATGLAELGVEEPVLLVVDRQATDWQAEAYFLVAEVGQVVLRWFAEAPPVPLLGRLLLALRPPQVLDPTYLTEPWQFEE
ncbi:MAG: RuBisCO accumulation factor 1 [Gloeomargarita sp. GMQP_bins_120]